jgi:RimJ/RimL family protein N-acetyltransferase
LASDGTVKGIGGAVLEWAVNKCGNVRIDTHKNNATMRRVLEKNGWTYCGTILIDSASDRERMAFQKMRPQND